ncbi:hypothetical protein PR002_g17421 [Phytophthora rubi]|uniref:Uncharacterized protein n=1 Tax=Phytophthora rubi TaxID=129364 RepID=A0A6A3K9P0_9STRA|nr:hypothetical protein PR002_g17421 [Phytophthora rubi]
MRIQVQTLAQADALDNRSGMELESKATNTQIIQSSFYLITGKWPGSGPHYNNLPQILTKLNPTRGTAHVALVTGSVIAQVLVIVLHYAIGDTRLSSAIVNSSLIGAIVSRR